MPVMHLLYPERRTIRTTEVIVWAHDEWANNAPRRRCDVCGVVTVAESMGRVVAPLREGEFATSDPLHPCTCVADSTPLYDDGEQAPLSLADAADYLEDIGVATFARNARVTFSTRCTGLSWCPCDRCRQGTPSYHFDG